jgi:hypothetical protein
LTSQNPLLAFGPPPDGAASLALALAVVWTLGLVVAHRRPPHLAAACHFLHVRWKWVLLALAVTSTLLSLGYVAFYLRGGPRIIDATAYFLEARALSEGSLAWTVPSPSAAFRGRFLTHAVPTTEGELSLGVLFPPGYPAVLALGFLLGKPLWVGPVLGSALVLITYAIGLRLTNDRLSALLAAALSTTSAALRYHTADTMSHGLAALLFSGAILAALPPRNTATADPSVEKPSYPLRPLLGGLCLGWLFATRPVSAVACGLVCAWLVAPGGLRRLPPWALGALPGMLLLLAHQRAVTGDFFGSTQLHYYGLSDGPPGCFRLGFGAGHGCTVEHGDVVERFGPAGYTLGWALRHTLHRLQGHALDLANFELLWLIVPWTLWRQRARREARAIALALVAVVTLYGAFYFNGSYPGGGARFFAELLPLEQAALAWGAQELGKRRFVLPLSLAGFAVHASFSHVALRERDGGRPFFEPELVQDVARGASALVFVDTDHGFNLGHDPALLRRQLGPGDVLVARRRSDAHDRLLWETLGRPPTFRYRFARKGTGASQVLPHEMGPEQPTLRFESEAEWPPLSVEHTWTAPIHSGAPCVSQGRALLIQPGPPETEVSWELPVRQSGLHHVRLALAGPVPEGSLLRVQLGATEGSTAPVSQAAVTSGCPIIELGEFELTAPGVHLTLSTAGHTLSVDFVELTPVETQAVKP